MKIALVSDVHLEFGFLDIRNTENADVLILSGDICVASALRDRDTHGIIEGKGHSESFHKFFQQACDEFKNVIYVMGNHEHYNGDFALSETNIRSKLAYLKNLHFLEKSCVKIDDVTFIGGTLWTDMNKEDPHTMFHVQRRMNDFRIVQNSNRMKNQVPSVLKMLFQNIGLWLITFVPSLKVSLMKSLLLLVTTHQVNNRHTLVINMIH